MAAARTTAMPGFIRVDADEVTYPAHVILRYRLEQALISGDLKLIDLPGAWNEGMKQLLGLTVTNDRDGCLQDIHWPEGMFGYFPTYTLGAMTAAQLMAAWQCVGFCHGVMNTDNMSLLGLTLDYGPFGFLDGFDPGHICNHSDHQGRYAFARQPQMAFWNLHALAQALLPLMPNAHEDAEAAGDELLEALEVYRERFGSAMLAAMRTKLGLLDEREEDAALVDDWLRLLAAQHTDYTIAHRRLGSLRPDQDNPALRDLFIDRAAWEAWARRYAQRLQAEGSEDAARSARMRRANPAVVLRTHLAETAIRRAEAGDFSEVQRLQRVLSQPWDDPAEPADADFPPDWAQQLEVSCSS